MNNKDYYKILGVDKNASQEEIKSAFRKQAKKYQKGRGLIIGIIFFCNLKKNSL